MIRFEGKGLSPGLAQGAAYVRVDALESKQTTRPVPEHLISAEYGRILDAMEGRESTLRLLEIGGDRSIPYLSLNFRPDQLSSLRVLGEFIFGSVAIA